VVLAPFLFPVLDCGPRDWQVTGGGLVRGVGTPVQQDPACGVATGKPQVTPATNTPNHTTKIAVLWRLVSKCYPCVTRKLEGRNADGGNKLLAGM